MIKGVLLDLAGVLYDGPHAIAGSVEAVERLRTVGLPIRFLTNSTRSPRRILLKNLYNMGFEISEDELFTPARAACALLQEQDMRAHLLIHPDLSEDFADGPRTGARMAVVVGDAAQHFSYDAMNSAFRALSNGAHLLALANNRQFRDTDGALSIDAGAFVAALEYASGVKAQILGKPAPDYFAAALNSMGCPAEQAAMIGDDAEADVAGALNAGLGHAVLVRTGKYRTGDENAYHPAPSHVADNLSAAVDQILDEQK